MDVITIYRGLRALFRLLARWRFYASKRPAVAGQPAISCAWRMGVRERCGDYRWRLLFFVWRRRPLEIKWSRVVTVKECHKLIMSGPPKRSCVTPSIPGC
jgi:hypothetical protein